MQNDNGFNADQPPDPAHSIDSPQERPLTELSPQNQTEQKPRKKHRIIKWLAISAAVIVFVVGGALWWLLYFRHFTLWSRSKDIKVIKAAIFEGTMNQFAPTLGPDDSTVYMNRQIFEGLVRFEDKTKVVPCLATSWKNPDNKTWIFTLKQGVKFHDGDTFSAKDVAYSYEQYKKNTSFSYVTSSIDKVQAIGENQVKITTKTVDPILLNRLIDMFIVDSAANGKADPVYGTGPYTLKSNTLPTANHIELEAFPSYHGGTIHTKEVQVTVYGDDQMSAVTKDFILGKINLVAFVPTSVVDTAASLHFHSGSRDDPSVYEIGFNIFKKGSPVGNLKIRQAIAKSIDVQALLKAIDRDKTGTQQSQILTPDIPGYSPDIKPLAIDRAGARQLVREAGYPNGVTIILSVFSAAKDAGEEIARQLSESGITVKLDVRDDVTSIQSDLENGKLEAFYYAESTSLLDGSDVFSKIAQSDNYQNKVIDKLLLEANSTLDASKRLKTLQEASKALAEDEAVIPLYSNRNQWIMDRAYVTPEDTLVSGLGVYMYKVHLP